MDNPADNLDQTDEEILTYTVSDEALEASAWHHWRPVRLLIPVASEGAVTKEQSHG
jgi:hypothetical protein